MAFAVGAHRSMPERSENDLELHFVVRINNNRSLPDRMVWVLEWLTIDR